ncbi:uncharacterized protein DUF4235 [Kribbella rubisoli]|uniref:Uncharacterized protein DUF4235 n=1 Tax=Kribbella rubisoli TaxID=3075929 RepID=A0A4Q7VXC4_9ACTN|nr:DUF4235 domain-containing protein [Kribbella rubisoli]RZU01381.1 uncharacterized protein DUF4235 [Kribbella rubisoli]
MIGAKIGWKLVQAAFTIVVGLAASKAVTTAWKLGSGGKPPKDGTGGYAEVITWAAASAGAAAAARLFAERRAAAYWLKSTGYAPPGYEQAAADGSLLKSISKKDD